MSAGKVAVKGFRKQLIFGGVPAMAFSPLGGLAEKRMKKAKEKKSRE
jgi:hypothetical protein